MYVNLPQIALQGPQEQDDKDKRAGGDDATWVRAGGTLSAFICTAECDGFLMVGLKVPEMECHHRALGTTFQAQYVGACRIQFWLSNWQYREAEWERDSASRVSVTALCNLDTDDVQLQQYLSSGRDVSNLRQYLVKHKNRALKSHKRLDWNSTPTCYLAH